jgi:hypothetical protein
VWLRDICPVIDEEPRSLAVRCPECGAIGPRSLSSDPATRYSGESAHGPAVACEMTGNGCTDQRWPYHSTVTSRQ